MTQLTDPQQKMILLTKDSDVWDVQLLAEYLGCCHGTIYRNANKHKNAYYGAWQPGGRNTEWRFLNPLRTSVASSNAQ